MDKKMSKIIADVKLALEAMDIQVTKIILFGSHAQGTAHEHSDIDLAIISEDFKDMNLLRRLELIGIALARAKIMDPVEVIAYTEEEFKSKREGTFAGDEIKAKGVEIQQRITRRHNFDTDNKFRR
ncbi:MAG: nucleotidyltransferase domain-containing protein [Candidatus Brocadia sp. WS118]|nr:MAG: nucleotidyltransferase domain-containing protein [Candidatus Brocadia sp. WS118]